MELQRDNQSQHDQERLILCQMITNTKLLQTLYPVASPELFENPYAQRIIRWIKDYFKQAGQAPGRDIESIYLNNRGQIVDSDEAENIAVLLRTLSKDWEKFKINNTDYTANSAMKYLKLQALKRHSRELEMAIASGDPARGEQVIADFKRVESPKGHGVDILSNAEKISEAFSNEEERLFKLQGDLGKVLGWFVRGELVGILSPTKGGKSWCQWYCAMRASLLNLRALYINLEITEKQLIRRVWESFTGRPRETSDVEIPRFVVDGSKFRIEYRQTKMEGVNPDIKSIETQQKKFKRQIREGGIRLETFPRFQASLGDIKALLDNLEYYENFVPDVIIVDYADVLRPEYQTKNHLQDENRIWMDLAGLATQRNCCIITATQGNRSSWGGKEYGLKGTGGVYEKLSHVGKLLSLTATDEEKERGVTRVNLLLERDGKFSSQQVVVLQSLDIGRWYLDSRVQSVVKFDSAEGTE